MPKGAATADPKTPWDKSRNNFDALRIGLALLVLFSHSFPLGVGSETREPVAVLTRGQMTGGAIAVDLFFVMSGFMIAGSMERSRSVWTYLKRRVARIYPAFLVCALLCFTIAAPLSGAVLLPGRAQRVADFVLQTARLREFTYTDAFARNPYPGHAINGSVWSIQYEFWCYLGVALLGITGLLKRRGVLLLSFAAALMLSVLFLLRGWLFGGKFLGVLLGSPQLWARLLPLYLAGVVFYRWRDRIPHSGPLALAAVGLLAVGARMPYGLPLLFPVAGTYLVFYLAYAEWLPMQSAGRLGDVSYGLYLYAFPIQQMLMQRFGHAVSPAVLFAAAAPLTVLAAVASWFLVERRFLRRARQHARAAPSADSAGVAESSLPVEQFS